jgi:hypothetical protein
LRKEQANKESTIPIVIGKNSKLQYQKPKQRLILSLEFCFFPEGTTTREFGISQYPIAIGTA